MNKDNRVIDYQRNQKWSGCDRISEVYEGGQQPCLFGVLLLGSARDVFHDQDDRP